MLRKISLLLPHLVCSVEFEFSWFHNTKQSSEILILKIEMLLEFQNRRILKSLGSINDFGLALDSSDIDLWNMTHTFRFVRYRYLHFFVSKTSWRCFQDMSSRRLQRNNFQEVIKTSSRRLARCLQDVLKTSWKTKNCCAEDVLKTSSRHVLKTSTRRLEDQQMFARLHLEAH